MKAGIRDVIASISRRDIWLYFAISDTKARYARSTLGPWWITLGTALGVIGLAVVWSAVMGIDLHFMLPNLAVGLVLWFFMAGVINESANCFVNQAAIIKNYSLPQSLHTLRLLSRHLINFSHNLFIIIIAFIIYGAPSLINIGWAILGFFLIIVNLWWISLLISTLGARYRDLAPSIEALMPILFFLTPILYKKSDITSSITWFDYNPIATLFSLAKNPLLSLPINAIDYVSMAIFSVLGWAVTMAVFGSHKKTSYSGSNMARIELSNVSLAFPVITEAGASLRKKLVRMSTGGIISSDDSHTVHIKALNNINLTLKEGDRVGLIGHNGSGKSTLLRTLAGIYEPTHGSRYLEGSVRALFDLGVGTDHELSGRENVARLARLYGFPLGKLNSDITSIESFSGLGGYMDLPIRSYSSGMQLRLIFAIATLYPSDILLIDEVFGVGDEAFQETAKQRMEDMMRSSKIVVMASHSRELISKFCNKTIKLESGNIVEVQSTVEDA